MKPLGRRGSYTLLFDDGTLPGERSGPRRRLWRARNSRNETVHVIGFEVDDVVADAVCRACFGATVGGHGRERALAFPYTPGVFLLDVVAQGALEGGEVPVEAAVYVVRSAARRLAALRHARRAAGGLVDRVRVGFYGDVGVWLCSDDHAAHRVMGFVDRIQVLPANEARELSLFVPDPDDDDAMARIGMFPMMGGRRRAPVEEAASPEEANGAVGDARSEVFVLAGLLWLVLTGAHPFARGDLLSSLGALRAAELPTLSRALAPELLQVLLAALSLDPALRPETPAAFADALDVFVDDDAGRAATAALTRGLFPSTFAADVAFVEEADLFDVNADFVPPPVPPPPKPPAPLSLSTRTPARVRVPRRRIEVSTHLVTNAQVMAWADDVGVTLPPGFPIDPLLAPQPAVWLPVELASSVAVWLGGRLPDDDEFTDFSAGGGVGVDSGCGVVDLCLCWEWTRTSARTGRVVRGGPWRNREERGLVDNRSWEDEAAGDVGFRVVFDVR